MNNVECISLVLQITFIRRVEYLNCHDVDDTTSVLVRNRAVVCGEAPSGTGKE